MCVLESSFDCGTRDLRGRRGPGGSEEVMVRGLGEKKKKSGSPEVGGDGMGRA